MFFSSISLNITSFEFEISVELAMILQLLGGISMKINYGSVKALIRDDITNRINKYHFKW